MTALEPIPVLDGQLVIPTMVQIPESLDTAAQQLAALDGLATASEWARAAIVATFVHVEDTRGGDRRSNAEVRLNGLLSTEAFAARGFAGLKSDNTVRRYVQAWGDRPRPTPGQPLALPAEPFRLPSPRDSRRSARIIDVPDHVNFDLRVGDFRDVLADVTCDVVLTDPPYPREYLPLYADLAKWADDILPPAGLLAVMVGQSYLPELFNLLDGHRPYRWTLAYLTPGGQSTQLWERNVNTFWKPILIYGHTAKDTRWIGDVPKSDVNDNDKDHHEWGQSVSGMRDLVRRLSDPGHTICDPFMGAGTTGVAAAWEGRHFIGCDIDPAHVATAAGRLA